MCVCVFLTPTCNDRRGSPFHQRIFLACVVSDFDGPPGLLPDHKINNILYSLSATVHHMLDQLERDLMSLPFSLSFSLFRRTCFRRTCRETTGWIACLNSVLWFLIWTYLELSLLIARHRRFNSTWPTRYSSSGVASWSDDVTALEDGRGAA